LTEFGLKATLAWRFSHHVDQLDSGKDSVGGLLRFEPEHRLDTAFDPSMIRFNTIGPSAYRSYSRRELLPDLSDYLTRLKSRAETPCMRAFRRWLLAEIDGK
jgi:hypothetical protein